MTYVFFINIINKIVDQVCYVLSVFQKKIIIQEFPNKLFNLNIKFTTTDIVTMFHSICISFFMFFRSSMNYTLFNFKWARPFIQRGKRDQSYDGLNVCY